MKQSLLTIIPIVALLGVGVAGCSNDSKSNASTASSLESTKNPASPEQPKTPEYAPGIPENYKIDPKSIDVSICEAEAYTDNQLTMGENGHPAHYKSQEDFANAKESINNNLGDGFFPSPELKAKYDNSPFLAWARSIANYWTNDNAYNPQTKQYNPQYLAQLNNFKKVCGAYYKIAG